MAAPSAEAASGDDAQIAGAYIRALGGAANLDHVDACTTRLRLELANRDRVDTAALKRLGAAGTVRVGERGLQVVVGPQADQVASAIRSQLHAAPEASAPPAGGNVLAALGGKANVRALEQIAGRLVVTVVDSARVDERSLMEQGMRAVAIASSSSVHVLHADVDALERGIAPLLA